MNNIADDLFDFVWDPISEKLLVCKDDSTIDLQHLMTTYQVKSITDITCNMNKSPMGLYEVIHYNICVAYMMTGKSTDFELYRIFKVDYVNNFIAFENYFVGILQFTQAEFENLILCNRLLEELYESEGDIIDYFNYLNIGLNILKAEKDTEVLLQPLQKTILHNITHHLINKW
jgi:hypothetical protein